jgi:hypothetical protein
VHRSTARDSKPHPLFELPIPVRFEAVELPDDVVIYVAPRHSVTGTSHDAAPVSLGLASHAVHLHRNIEVMDVLPRP